MTLVLMLEAVLAVITVVRRGRHGTELRLFSRQ